MNSSIRVLTKPGIDVEGSQHWFDNVCIWGLRRQICHPSDSVGIKAVPDRVPVRTSTGDLSSRRNAASD